MSDIAAIYDEFDEANRAFDYLRAVNSYSLDTPQKRLEWDVAYQDAAARLIRAIEAKNELVRRSALERSKTE